MNDQGAGTLLRVLSYNIQVGIATHHYRHYLLNAWQHVLPSERRWENLDRTAPLLAGYDLVGLQEADAGGLRSDFVNQVEYLATKGRLPFWSHRTNRNLAGVAKHSLGLLSRFRPSSVSEHRLPGLIPGRGALMATFVEGDESLAVLNLHLALGARARQRQLAHVAELIADFDHAIVMGDLNCRAESEELRQLTRRSALIEPRPALNTFPSWRPRHNIDHILITPGLLCQRMAVLNHPGSDHLPICMALQIPATVALPPAKGDRAEPTYMGSAA